MARAALSRLGEPAATLLQADLVNIWVSPDVTVSVDAERQEAALKAALDFGPGQLRDDSLVKSLSENGLVLADEPYADWALRAREELEALRQQARLALARDRSRGFGRAGPGRRPSGLGSMLCAGPHLRGGRDCPRVGLLQAGTSQRGGGDL